MVRVERSGALWRRLASIWISRSIKPMLIAMGWLKSLLGVLRGSRQAAPLPIDPDPDDIVARNGLSYAPALMQPRSEGGARRRAALSSA
jgi:hypothetical protein